VVAARLAGLFDQRRRRLARLLLAAVAVVRGDGVRAAVREAGEQALDGPHGDREFRGAGAGVGALLPAGKKVAREWVPAGHAA
jgi:hypothetical protein